MQIRVCDAGGGRARLDRKSAFHFLPACDSLFLFFFLFFLFSSFFGMVGAMLVFLVRALRDGGWGRGGFLVSFGFCTPRSWWHPRSMRCGRLEFCVVSCERLPYVRAYMYVSFFV